MTLGPFLGFLCYVLGTKSGGVLLFRMCFEKGVWLFVSGFGGCLIAAAPQQQQQPPAAAPAAGSSREQQAGSSRQQQVAAGSSRQQQTPAEAAAGSSRQRQAAAKLQFYLYSRVSEVTLGPFLGFLCYVLGTKLGGVLLFRMCFEKGVWLFVSCFGGCLIAAAPQQHQQQQQQQQPPAAAPAGGSSREQQAGSRRQPQAAAGSCRQQQAAAGSSRHQQRQQQAAAGSGKVSILQYGFRSDIRSFFGVTLLRFGHEIRWCFAVPDVFRKGCLLTFTLFLNYSKIDKTWCWLVESLK